MSNNFEKLSAEIDELLEGIDMPPVKGDALTHGEQNLFTEIDDLCGQVDDDIARAELEMSNWPVARKRKEANDSKDVFVLDHLSHDENFVVRTLVLCNPHIPIHILRRSLEGANDYRLMVIANNPVADAVILARIVDLTREPEVLAAVKKHPHASPVTKFKIDNPGV